MLPLVSEERPGGLILRMEVEPQLGTIAVVRESAVQVVPLPSTSCFLIDLDILGESFSEFQNAFPGCDVFYALKANPELAIIRYLARRGCGFEAASWGEIEVLLDTHVKPDRIIYGTAVKPRSHVECAFASGINCFAADSWEEIHMLAATAPGTRFFLRIKADDSSSVFRLNRKFGVAVEQAEALYVEGARLGLVPWGISFNVGSQARRPTVWAESIAACGPLLRRLRDRSIILSVIDIGGGFPEQYHGEKPSPLEDISKHVFDALQLLPYQPRLLAEPGRKLVARCATLVATIIARIERPDGAWLFLDCGVYNALFEALKCQGETRYEVTAGGTASDGPSLSYTLAGPTGDSLDVIAEKVLLPQQLKAGDHIYFQRVGAYTTALASSFNGFSPPPVKIVGAK